MKCSNCQADVSDDSLYCKKCGASLICSDVQITRADNIPKSDQNHEFDFKIGEKFGNRYKIIEELGKGGMGCVFKAHDNILDTDVALKMIRPEFLSNKKMIARFKKEILLAREITHENVVRIYDFGDVDGTKFISMEYINGKTLKDIIKENGPFESENTISIIKEICMGLDAAHKKDIIHRDLKPQNIMIDIKGKIYITDFGLAKSVREEYVSHTGLVIGTPQYIPPELWKGEEADKRSDIYTLGIIMYEMVTGNELFRTDSDYGYLQKHLHEDPEFPLYLKEKYPNFFINIIRKCLAKERISRYQNCMDVYRDLDDRMFSKGVLITEVKRSIRKTGPTKIILSVLFILSVSLLSIVLVKKKPGYEHKRSVAILYFKNLSGSSELDHFTYSLPELLTTDLGQSKYIRVLPEEKINSVLNSSDYLDKNIVKSELFQKAGKKIKANYFVQGSFIKSGEDLRISIILRETDSGEILTTNQCISNVGNIFPVIDKFTKEIKKSIKLSDSEILADVDNNIEDITTSSPEALKYYIFGKKLFNEGDFKGSLIEYEKAVEIDHEFAMAYRDMAYAYVYLGDMKKRIEYFRKTFKYINKMSEKEKLLIYADYYGEIEINFTKAHESYNKLLKIYPDDINANLESGFFYSWLEQWDNAIEKLENVISEDSSNLVALRDIVTCFFGKGDYDKVENIIANFEKVFPDQNKSEIRRLKYYLFMLQKKFDLATQIVRKQKEFQDIDDQEYYYLTAKIELLKGNLINGEDVYSKMLNSTEGILKYNKIVNFEYMFLFEGKFRKAFEILDDQIKTLKYKSYIRDAKFKKIFIKIISGDYSNISKLFDSLEISYIEKFSMVKTRFLYLKGFYSLKSGDVSGAEKFAYKLKKISETNFFKKQTLRLLFHLQGLIEKEKGRYEQAKQLFMKGLEISSYEWGSSDIFVANRALFYYSLGQTYFLTNEFDGSEKWFKKIGDLSLSRYYFGNLYAKSFYYLGKIYRKKGWIGKAIENYEKFVSMWETGDKAIVGEYVSNAMLQIHNLKKKF